MCHKCTFKSFIDYSASGVISSIVVCLCKFRDDTHEMIRQKHYFIHKIQTIKYLDQHVLIRTIY